MAKEKAESSFKNVTMNDLFSWMFVSELRIGHVPTAVKVPPLKLCYNSCKVGNSNYNFQHPSVLLLQDTGSFSKFKNVEQGHAYSGEGNTLVYQKKINM